MTNITVGIVFGGCTPEHNETIRAARFLYEYAIRSRLENKYKFKYFYLTMNNEWASAGDSKRVLLEHPRQEYLDSDRVLDLANVDVIYNCCMGPCGENGNIQGLADIYKIPVIGCGILPSALSLDKRISKVLAQSINIPVVDYLYVDEREDPQEIISKIHQKIKFPCFVKPNNLGTCAFLFRANNEDEFIRKWEKSISANQWSSKYLIEKFIPNIEVRVFVYEDYYGNLHFNDDYVTTLRERALVEGGGLFDHIDNEFPNHIRKKIRKYAFKIFKHFNMKDYARIDFFVSNENKIYFNEANTQPFISSFNIKLMEKDGITYPQFLNMMIKKNLRKY